MRQLSPKTKKKKKGEKKKKKGTVGSIRGGFFISAAPTLLRFSSLSAAPPLSFSNRSLGTRSAAPLLPHDSLVSSPSSRLLLTYEIRSLSAALPLGLSRKHHARASPLGCSSSLGFPSSTLGFSLCLKMLKQEELNKLEFPENTIYSSPVKSVIYKTDLGQYPVEGNTTMLRHQNGTARFNLFTGYQTLEDREESFIVKDNAEVHCGFYSDIGGFRISDEDKLYMKNCKAVVSTCAFGGGDDLYQPIGMSEASLNKVCFVAFWDELTRAAQEAEGNKLGDDGMIGIWRIVVVRDLPFSDQRLNGKIPKMLSHRLFPQARYSIWVDSKSQLRRDPLGVLEALLWRTNSVFAISQHGARSNLYDEAKAIVKKHKATPEEVDLQIKQYHYDGIPADSRIHGKKALAEASIIVREHTPLTNLFTCLWFNEVVRFTSRDQLSFPYVLRRLWIPKMNMFPVCTRRDLVNSMGHRRKVKPLERQM